MCIIAPNGFMEHRCPVDCYRFFTDGMVALAKYVGLDILHAHTNYSPKGGKWYSYSKADSVLVAMKNHEGVKLIDLSSYKCEPVNHLFYGFPFEPYKPNLLIRGIRKTLRILKII